jgi:hypothetical protein
MSMFRRRSTLDGRSPTERTLFPSLRITVARLTTSGSVCCLGTRVSTSRFPHPVTPAGGGSVVRVSDTSSLYSILGDRSCASHELLDPQRHLRRPEELNRPPCRPARLHSSIRAIRARGSPCGAAGGFSCAMPLAAIISAEVRRMAGFRFPSRRVPRTTRRARGDCAKEANLLSPSQRAPSERPCLLEAARASTHFGDTPRSRRRASSTGHVPRSGSRSGCRSSSSRRRRGARRSFGAWTRR